MKIKIISALIFSCLIGCSISPRVLKCPDCKYETAVTGGLLPGQTINCPKCHTRMFELRKMSQQEWQQHNRRGCYRTP